MSAPSEDQILKKAKELCRCECKAWNLDNFENGVLGVTMLTVVADDNDRTYYLSESGEGVSKAEVYRPVAVIQAPTFPSPGAYPSSARYPVRGFKNSASPPR
jgi:hypothetical protein